MNIRRSRMGDGWEVVTETGKVVATGFDTEGEARASQYAQTLDYELGRVPVWVPDAMGYHKLEGSQGPVRVGSNGRPGEGWRIFFNNKVVSRAHYVLLPTAKKEAEAYAYANGYI